MECAVDDVGGDVVENAAALRQEGEAAFADAAQCPEEHVVAAVVHRESATICWSFERGEHAVASAFVGGIGQRGQPAGRGGIERAQRMGPRGGQVVR